MIKSVSLVCAAVLTVASSAYGMSLAGWLGGNSPTAEVQAQASDPCPSDAAIRFRQNQNINWRCVMMLQE